MHSITTRPLVALVVAALTLSAAACSNSTQADSAGATDSPNRGEQPNDTEEVADGLLPATDDGLPDPSNLAIDEPEPVVDESQPELGNPDDLIDEAASQLAEVDDSDTTAEILSTVKPIDTAPELGAEVNPRDGRSRNEAGELSRLDEPAALACGDIERALTAMDEGDRTQARDLVTSASAHAADSSINDITTWSETLSAIPSSDDLSPLLGFLTACTQGGYEL